MIVSFRHKGLERLYRDGSTKGVQAAHVPKLLVLIFPEAVTQDDPFLAPVKTGAARIGLGANAAGAGLGETYVITYG